MEIDTNTQQVQSQINIKDLSKIEISIIASMFHSKELFSKITNSLVVEDFTFLDIKKLFEYFKTYSKEVDFYNKEDEKVNIAKNIAKLENMPIRTAFNIIGSKPSKNIDLDLFELLDFSNKRKKTFKQTSNEEEQNSTIVIEDEYGEYISVYCNGVIKEIVTSYIFHIPEELCDTFQYTFEKITPYIGKEDFSLTMEVDEDDSEELSTDEINAYIFTKNITKIQQLENLLEWGKKNNLKPSIFPRNRGFLLNTILLELENQNLKYIPDEFCQVLRPIFLILSNNQIEHIPQNINLIRGCLMLELCNNKIKSLPDNLFQFRRLSTLCLHSNMLIEIPSEIGNLLELENLNLSNNPISNLPSSINKLINLKELDIENTFINESSLKYLNLENIEKISFDDRLLPYFIQHFHLLKNIDTINLSHSEYKIDNQIFDSLKLNLETKNWMEEKDYKGHGCIVLKKELMD